MAELSKDYDPAGKRKSEREREFNRLFDQRMGEPSSLPGAFKSWSKSYMEGSNLQIPVGQIIGLKSLDSVTTVSTADHTYSTTETAFTGVSGVIRKTGVYLVIMDAFLDISVAAGGNINIRGYVDGVQFPGAQIVFSHGAVGVWTATKPYLVTVDNIGAGTRAFTMTGQKTAAGATVTTLSGRANLTAIRIGEVGTT